MLSEARAEAVTAEAERVLRQNWLEGRRGELSYAYTQPSPGRYPWQWYWDSCFHAIVRRRFERRQEAWRACRRRVAERDDGGG